MQIDFETPLIGRQRLALELNAGAFRNEISRARTFGFMRDVENLWKAGLALGASLDNCIALADDRVMNAEGLRYPQEFVRHKVLDAVGDLALAGAPMLAAYRSVRGGHRLNAHVLQALFADKDAWTMVRAPGARDRPGRGADGDSCGQLRRGPDLVSAARRSSLPEVRRCHKHMRIAEVLLGCPQFGCKVSRRFGVALSQIAARYAGGWE